MKNELNKRHNDIEAFGKLGTDMYENIFNVYKADEDYYAYNISKSVHIPHNIDPKFIDYIRVAGKQTWTNLSFQIYGSITLWWLILVTNGIQNPVLLPEPGMVLKIIKPEFVDTILQQIKD